MQKEGQAIAAPRRRRLWNVDRIRLEAPPELALAVGWLAAELRVLGALSGLEVAREDPVHRSAGRDAVGLAVQVVGDPAGELAEVDFGVERAQVALGQRRALRAIAPPRRV